jgi:hypothetical protein
MVVATVAIAAIIIGVVALTVSTLGALAIFTAPAVSSPQDKYPINDREYYDHKRANKDQKYAFSNLDVYSPSPVYI